MTAFSDWWSTLRLTLRVNNRYVIDAVFWEKLEEDTEEEEYAGLEDYSEPAPRYGFRIGDDDDEYEEGFSEVEARSQRRGEAKPRR